MFRRLILAMVVLGGMTLPLWAKMKVKYSPKIYNLSPDQTMQFSVDREVDWLYSGSSFLYYYDVFKLKVPVGFKASVWVQKCYSNMGAFSGESNCSGGIHVCVDDPNTVTKELYTSPARERETREYEGEFHSDAVIYLRPFVEDLGDCQYNVGVDVIPLIVDIVVPKVYNGKMPYFSIRPTYKIEVTYTATAPVAKLELPVTTATVPKAAGTGTFKVSANSSWTAKVASGGSWLSVTKGGSGNGNGSVSYSCSANKGLADREGRITVTSGSSSVSFTVKQAGSGATAKPNLAFYCPSGASKAVYLGHQAKSAAGSATFELGDAIYLHCAFMNGGGGTASSFKVKHQVLDSSGKELKSSSGTHGPLAKGEYLQWDGVVFSILQNLSVGSYTYVCTLDADGSVAELNESDNVTKVAFSVSRTKVTVLYDANGGSCSVSSKDYPVGGKFGTMPKATRPDYAFDGWFSSRTGGEQVSSSSVVSDRTLYAHWTKIEPTYTVVFRSSASSESMPPQTCKCDAATRLNANLFTNAGYAFRGWAREEIGAARIYADGESVKLSSVAGETVVLYAQWEPVVQKVYVSFSASEAYGGNPADMDYVVGRTYGYLPQVWRSDAVFAGWFVSSSPGARRVTETDTVLASVTRLYARWTANAYIVRFDPNGGEGSMSDQVFAVGVPQTLSKCSFSRSGYYFAGWSRFGIGGAICAPDGGDMDEPDAYDGQMVTLYAVWIRDLPDFAVDNPVFPGETLDLRRNQRISVRVSNVGHGAAAPTEVALCWSAGYSTFLSEWGPQDGEWIVPVPALAPGESTTVHYDIPANMFPASPSAPTTLYVHAIVNREFKVQEAGASGNVSGSATARLYDPDDESWDFGIGMYVSAIDAETHIGRLSLVTKVNGRIPNGADVSVFDGTPDFTGKCLMVLSWYGLSGTMTLEDRTGGGSTVICSATPAANQITNEVSFAKGEKRTFAVVRKNAVSSNYYVSFLPAPDSDSPAKFRVGFDDGTESSVLETRDYVAGRPFGSFPAKSRVGCALRGWYHVSDDGLMRKVSESRLAETRIDRLVAAWDVGTAEVSFDPNGGNPSRAGGVRELRLDDSLTLDKAGIERPGYALVGWAETRNGPVKYGIGEKVAAGAIASQDGERRTFYAVWAPNSYTVRFDPNGGEGFASDAACVYGERRNTPDEGFSKEGCVFAGWAFGPGEDAVFAPGEAFENLTGVPNGSVTLHAVWIPIPPPGPIIRDGCLVGYEGMCPEELVIGDDVTRIADSALAGCGMKRLIVPQGVRHIGANALRGCEDIAAIYFGGDAPEMEDESFAGTPRTMVSYVIPGTSGWGESVESGMLWPTTGDSRPVAPSPPGSILLFANMEIVGAVETYLGAALPELPANIAGLDVLGWSDDPDLGSLIRPGEVMSSSSPCALHAVLATLDGSVSRIYQATFRKLDGTEGSVRVSTAKGSGQTTAFTAKVTVKGKTYSYKGGKIVDGEVTKLPTCSTRGAPLMSGILFNGRNVSGTLGDDDFAGREVPRPVIEGVTPSDNAMVGVKYECAVQVADDFGGVKYSASGLPAGLKINASTGVISGVPAKAKTYSKVKITATSKVSSSYKATQTFAIKIDALPSWARGTFNGEVDVNGVRGKATISVGSTGKVSAKFAAGGTNWTCSATGYSTDSDSAAGRFCFDGTVKAQVSKKLTLSAPLKFGFIVPSASGPAATYVVGSWTDEAGSVPSAKFRAFRNPWKDSGASAYLSGWTGAYTWYDEGGGKLKMTLGSSGTVKVAGTLSNGRKLSFSVPLLHDFEDDRVPRKVVIYAGAASAKVNRKTVKYPEFFSLVCLCNEHHEPVAGGEIAYRDAGVRASVDVASTGKGSISYSTSCGQAASNKTVKVTAKAKSGSVFAYWMKDGEIVGYGSSYSVKMLGGDVTGVTAVFRAKGDFTENPDPEFADSSDFGKLCVGVKFTTQVAVDERFRPVKFTAKGLPDGLSINATTGVISGTPKKAGSKTITVTATCTGNTTRKASTKPLCVTVASLPKWAAQTFEGDLGTEDELVPVTVTIGSSGKVSGKYTLDGAKWTFSSSSLSSAVCDEATGEPSAFTANVTASATISKKKKSQKLVVTVTEEGVDIQAP